jgi:hypothetical protein
MATKEEIDNLKSSWAGDPIWDIETTDGFEEHEKELLVFRLECEEKWKKDAEEEFATFQKLTGTTKNKKLAMYLYAMANKIKKLEELNGQIL